MRNRKLGMTADHRKAMLRNQATSLIQYGRIETTDTRAKELRSVVEELVTLAKRGDLHARRQAASYVRDIIVDEVSGKILALSIPRERGFLGLRKDRDVLEIPWRNVIKIGNDIIIIEYEGIY